MYCVAMDNFPEQNYGGKMETFDTCMMDAANQQCDITRSVKNQAPTQSVQVDNQENHDALALQEQQQPQQPAEKMQQMTQIQSNTQGMSLTPVRLPAILDGEFFTVIKVEDTNVTVRCLECQKLLNGNLKSTGNFLSHIKVYNLNIYSLFYYCYLSAFLFLQRVHPLMIDKIKCKSNQRKPAMVYIDLSSDKCPEIVRSKRGYRKCYRTVNPFDYFLKLFNLRYMRRIRAYYVFIQEDCPVRNEESFNHSTDWNDPPLIRRRRSEEPESTDLLKISHNNSFVVEDEFDAIGRNVAAKLRNMRLDQRIIAEKLLNDILFEAQLGNLHRDSNIHV